MGTNIPNCSIRDATPDDASTVASIYNETVLASDATMDLAPRETEYFQSLIAACGPREVFIVLELDGEIVGWGRIMVYSDREGYKTTCETAVYLKRSNRRQGLGAMLKAEIVRRCKLLGYHHLVAKVFSDNVSSIEYNLKQGYEMVGVQREVGLVNGKWQDVTILQLVLSD